MLTCATCGQQSPEGFRFCPSCGQSLASIPGSTPAPGHAPGDEEPRTERRVVTILFCDLVGFTARSDHADPEDVRATLRPFHALARAEIERYGGTLDKFIGDAAMGVFGFPVAHEDDPERAVRAALGIVEGAHRLGQRQGRPPLDVRVGVNTGEAAVVLSAGVQEGENVAGDVVNTASRLQSAAPVGSVLVGEDTHRLTADAVDFEELDPVTAKGKAEPLRVWRARAIRALPTISDRPAGSSFVGRGPELATLEAAFERARSGPGLRFVTVVGAPGVGKSRLVAELHRSLTSAAAEGPRWLRGRCLPYGEGITFWALGEIVKAAVGVLESDPQAIRDGKLASTLDELVSDPPERAWLRARLSPLVGGEAGPPVERDEAFTAWRRFLEATARRQPLVMVVEDIHWADQAMLDFLEDLAERADHVSILVLATTRPELYDHRADWGRSMPNSEVVSMPPLSPEETATLLSELLAAGAAPSEPTRAMLLERSGGNPLFAEELARTLLDRPAPDGSAVEGGPGLEFPLTVQALIAARLDTLPPDRREILQDAAVVGTVFWSGAVAFVSGAEEASVGGHLVELDRKELVRPVADSSMREQAEYAFWHILVRDVAYGQIPRARRSALHRKVAGWLEIVGGARLADLAEILAHHAISALDLARAAGDGEDLGELEGTARRYLRLAAARTMALDLTKAERQLRQALALAGPEAPDLPTIQAGLAEVAFHVGRLDEAMILYEQAVAGLQAQGATRAAADAMTRLSVVMEYRGDKAQGRSLLARALSLLAAEPPGPEQARALSTSAGSLMIAGRYADAIVEADRAIALAGSVGEETAAARAHGFRGYSRAVQGDVDGIQEQRDALAALLALGLGRTAAIAYNNLGSCLTHVKGLEPALEVLRDGLAFADRRGLREMHMALQSATLTALFDTGSWDEALQIQREVEEEARREGSVYDEIYSGTDRALILAHRHGAEALEYCESIVAAARPLEDAPVQLRALEAAAIARQASGDADGTLAHVREAMEVTTGEALVLRVEELPPLTRLAVGAGDLDLADRLLEGADAFGLERQRLSTLAARAVLDEGRGGVARALVGFEEATAGWRRWGCSLERGFALAGAARCLSTLGRPAESQERLAEAEAIFGALGVGGRTPG